MVKAKSIKLTCSPLLRCWTWLLFLLGLAVGFFSVLLMINLPGPKPNYHIGSFRWIR